MDPKRLKDRLNEISVKLDSFKEDLNKGASYDVHVDYTHNGANKKHIFSGIKSLGQNAAISSAMDTFKQKFPTATVSKVKTVNSPLAVSLASDVNKNDESKTVGRNSNPIRSITSEEKQKLESKNNPPKHITPTIRTAKDWGQWLNDVHMNDRPTDKHYSKWASLDKDSRMRAHEEASKIRDQREKEAEEILSQKQQSPEFKQREQGMFSPIEGQKKPFTDKARAKMEASQEVEAKTPLRVSNPDSEYSEENPSESKDDGEQVLSSANKERYAWIAEEAKKRAAAQKETAKRGALESIRHNAITAAAARNPELSDKITRWKPTKKELADHVKEKELRAKEYEEKSGNVTYPYYSSLHRSAIAHHTNEYNALPEGHPHKQQHLDIIKKMMSDTIQAAGDINDKKKKMILNSISNINDPNKLLNYAVNTVLAGDNLKTGRGKNRAVAPEEASTESIRSTSKTPTFNPTEPMKGPRPGGPMASEAAQDINPDLEEDRVAASIINNDTLIKFEALLVSYKELLKTPYPQGPYDHKDKKARKKKKSLSAPDMIPNQEKPLEVPGIAVNE